MILSINDPVLHTYLCIIALIGALAFSIRRRTDGITLSKTTTLEIKGFALLAIVFSHVGYFLISDHRFLFPISTLAGVGVDLFLLLSGLGLTLSALSKKESIVQFYRRKLVALLIPFWIVLIAFFVLDYALLDRAYSPLYILSSFLGFFPRADLFLDVNSPLWYFTLILAYYVLFPILFYARFPLVTAAIIYGLTRFVVYLEPVFITEVLTLYEIHLVAFPLGILLGWLLYVRPKISNNLSVATQSVLLIALSAVIGYLALHTGVGDEPWIAQSLSIVTALLIVALFCIKQFEFRFLTLFGFYSFEIYLLHWPLMSRYDVFFTHLPASLALSLYLCFFLALSWSLQKAINYLSAKFSAQSPKV